METILTGLTALLLFFAAYHWGENGWKNKTVKMALHAFAIVNVVLTLVKLGFVVKI